VAAISGIVAAACGARHRNGGPEIQFTRIPQADSGGLEKNDIIEGVVQGGRPGQRIVLYARSGRWWIQPLRTNPFTRIDAHSHWTNATHLGTEYAAILADPGFQPPFTLDELPSPGGGVAAVAAIPGAAKSPSATVTFSGYEWRVRDAPSSRGGVTNQYDASNVFVDAGGAMHLQMKKVGQDWHCSEVSLSRSLGYGTYRFTVEDVAHFEPAVVFTIFTWDYSGGEPYNREMDIEMTRWGAPTSANGHFVVQPFHMAANAFGFEVPPGKMTHLFHWEPGRVTFRTMRGDGAEPHPAVVAEHVFTSGVPVPGIESVRMSHYAYHRGDPIHASDSEVVVDHFEYLP